MKREVAVTLKRTLSGSDELFHTIRPLEKVFSEGMVSIDTSHMLNVEVDGRVLDAEMLYSSNTI